MPSELTLACGDLIFPSASSNINAVISEIKRNELSIRNRLNSIQQDAAFVETAADQLHLPLIANERCGSWYIKPERKAGSAYFKSTDGHFGQWSFSLRRLNLQLLGIIQQGRGCLIVDSTRRGKSMPDALSKTVPIWLSVINRLLFPELKHSHALETPAEVVSESEHAQMEARIEGFVKDARSLDLNTSQLRDILQRPLRPQWLTPRSSIELSVEDSGYWPVILCTASSQVSTETTNDANYVQGAADDHESWAHGLTPITFWQHKEGLLATPEDHLIIEISRIVELAGQQNVHRQAALVQPTANLFIASTAAILDEISEMDVLIYCSPKQDIELETGLRQAEKTCIHLVCGEGKNGSRQLRTELAKLDGLIESISAGHILCTCSSGRDIAVGVALALLCKYYTSEGRSDSNTQPAINKAVIKQKLSWIMVSVPDASPSRATLQSVNAFLMS